MKNKFFLELRLVEDERISFVWICRSENLLWPNGDSWYFDGLFLKLVRYLIVDLGRDRFS